MYPETSAATKVEQRSRKRVILLQNLSIWLSMFALIYLSISEFKEITGAHCSSERYEWRLFSFLIRHASKRSTKCNKLRLYNERCLDITKAFKRRDGKHWRRDFYWKSSDNYLRKTVILIGPCRVVLQIGVPLIWANDNSAKGLRKMRENGELFYDILPSQQQLPSLMTREENGNYFLTHFPW